MGLFFGTVVRYDSTECKYEIQYDDGDFVKMTELEVLSSLMDEEDNLPRDEILPLSDRTNLMNSNNISTTMMKKKHNDDETTTHFKGDVSSTLVPPPQLSLPTVPPPLPPSKTTIHHRGSNNDYRRPFNSSKDAAKEKEEDDMMRIQQNTTTSSRGSQLAELRPDGEWTTRNHVVPMAEVVDEGSRRGNRRRHHRRQRDHTMSGEACVCKISGCVVM